MLLFAALVITRSGLPSPFRSFGDDGARLSADAVSQRRLERSIAVAEQQDQGIVEAIDDGKIGPPITIEVGDGNTRRAEAGRESW